MKTFLNLMNDNLGTNYKTVAEYGANSAKHDMTIVAETMYQYMYYQEAIEKADMDSFKVIINTVKTKKEAEKINKKK